ncbi:MAG: hypothetical protein E7453_08840 [Ruminococcaceae bacterium]|nr:hypothetical protein [Oscillospiraceae bacterium]
MFELTEKIAQASASEIEELLNAVLQRYSVLFPDWEISTISIQKSADRNEQLDRMITMLQNMKK